MTEEAKRESERRLPVFQGGKARGFLPETFDGGNIVSWATLHDCRQGTIRRERDTWIGGPDLETADVMAIAGFRF